MTREPREYSINLTGTLDIDVTVYALDRKAAEELAKTIKSAVNQYLTIDCAGVYNACDSVSDVYINGVELDVDSITDC